MGKNKLKAEIIRNNITIKEFAKRLGISTTTLWRKINDPSRFTGADIEATINILNLDGSQVMDIFFDKRVS